jgi:hypothetical protein
MENLTMEHLRASSRWKFRNLGDAVPPDAEDEEIELVCL